MAKGDRRVVGPIRESPIPPVRRHGRHSLFFKIFFVLLLTGLLSHLFVAWFHRAFWSSGARASAEMNLKHYARLLTDEIGIPPDTLVAARLSREMGLAIAVQEPRGWWHSPGFPGRFKERLQRSPPRLQRILEGDSIRLRLRRGRLLAIVPRAGHVFFYGSRLRQPQESQTAHWLLLFGSISLAWIAAWLLLRHLLRPVRALASGVQSVAGGNLDIRIPEKGHDELSDLARSFNAMAESLKERLRARDQLLLDVSHELRSPLTRMRVALEMAPPGSAMDSLREDVGALEKMITEILETERLQSGPGRLRKEPRDLASLISDTVSGFSGKPGISWKAPIDFGLVPLDADRLRLALRNILENALKYGGAAEKPVEVRLQSTNGFARIEIRDYGPGIPEDEQRLVFEPFYRVDRSRSRTPGYGLGLSLCKRILAAHGGDVSIQSKIGQGTTVILSIPLATQG